MVQNKALIYLEIPEEALEIGKHFKVQSSEFDLEQEPPKDGFTAKVHYVSYDPYQRNRMRDPSIESYVPAMEIGKPITNAAVVTVIKSDVPEFKSGDLVRVELGDTAEYTAIDGELLKFISPRKLDNPYKLAPELFLGPLGLAGLTAYSSLYGIGKPKRGETIFISSAAGAVGQLVGQMAKRDGLHVIGSVGSDDKLSFIVDKLGFDSGFNYKKEKPLAALERLAPKGIDIYYENVGGEHLEAAITSLRRSGRIIACGMISQYNLAPEKQYGVRNLADLVEKGLKLDAFNVTDEDMGPQHMEVFWKDMQRWLHEGSIKMETDMTRGIDNSAEGLIGLFSGQAFGKAMLEVSKIEA